MVRWSVFLFIVALCMALVGYSGVPGAAIGVARILFAVFFGAFVVSLFLGGRWHTQPPA